MKINNFLTIILIFLFYLSSPAKEANTITIIPKPNEMKIGKGNFVLNPSTKIIYSQGLDKHADFLRDYIKFSHNFNLLITDKITETNKNFIYLNVKDLNSDSEEYELDIQPSKIMISSESPKGVFYGIQTLRQLIHSGKKIQCLKIVDKPRFVYRGMHLDVSRHFMPKEFVKKYIDFLAMYKMNTFHWHLVDDQGWRLEIKKYPKLTEVGAWRVDRGDKTWREREPQKPGEVPTYGGFYTQEEVKDIVKYAADRYITIIPEIEMPGHCLAALTAYPEYSCTGGPFTVPPGTYWPPLEAFCAGNDKTFEFLEDILTETMELFSSKYIHIGGDEVVKTRWKECPKCQERMKKENLKDENELQSYFVKRIEKFLVSKGRKLIGWDEILEGGLAPEATVMSWRGTIGGIEAAKAGHDVIMTPTSYCYFDYYQGNLELEPIAIGGYLPLTKVYQFEPIPEELSNEEAKHILGAQGNVWAEFIPTTTHAEYMVFPRIAAMAEVVWTNKNLKDLKDFMSRLAHHTKLLDDLKINYAKSMYDVKITSILDTIKKQVKVEMSTEALNPDIRYTLDGTEPTKKSPKYKEPFILKKSAKIHAINFYDKNKKSKESTTEIVLHKGIASIVTNINYDKKRYIAKGLYNIVDGVRGSLNQNDGKWQGVQGNDFFATIDLGEVKNIKKVSIGFLQNYHFSIFLPRDLEVLTSLDGKEFKSVGKVQNTIPIDEKKIFVKDLSCDINDKARFIQIKASNIGVNPDTHPDKGFKSWLMFDEIIIE